MMTQGEQKIAEILLRENLPFEREFSFRDLKSRKGQLLRFDFLVHHPSLGKVLVEYDGEFHFHFIKGIHKSKSKFLYGRELDVRKNKYALMNKISLYRVPYTDKDKLIDSKSIFNNKYLVKDKYHNYRIGRKLN